MNTEINSVLLCGGTHGNEFSGVEIVNQWDFLQDHVHRDKSIKVETALVNDAAIKARKRFVDQDLNRQFTLSNLAVLNKANEKELCSEQILAKSLNAQYGPKTSPQIDLVIDIHNTTSNMGACIILLESGEFETQLARYVKSLMPSAVILVEDHIAYADHPYFCTLGKKGLMLELGPQSHGGQRYETYRQSVDLITHILRFLSLWNKNKITQSVPTEAFRLIEEIYYPTTDASKSAFIHPKLEGQDFQPLHHGDVCFISETGTEINWQGETVFPHFIGEVAYHHLNIAFATARKVSF